MFLERLKILKLAHLNSKKLKINTFGSENTKARTVQQVKCLIKTTDQKLIG